MAGVPIAAVQCKRLDCIGVSVEHEKFNKKIMLCQNKVVYLLLQSKTIV